MIVKPIAEVLSMFPDGTPAKEATKRFTVVYEQYDVDRKKTFTWTLSKKFVSMLEALTHLAGINDIAFDHITSMQITKEKDL